MSNEPIPSLEVGAERVSSRFGNVTQPVVAMLVVAAAFHVLWGKPLDGVVTIAVAVGASRTRVDGRELRAVRLRGAWPAVVVFALAYGALVGAWARFSWPTTVAIFLPGVVLLTIADRAPPRSAVPPEEIKPLGRWLWASLWLALCTWEVLAFVHQPSRTVGSHDHPTLSFLMENTLSSHAGRSVTLAVWILVGWALARR